MRLRRARLCGELLEERRMLAVVGPDAKAFGPTSGNQTYEFTANDWNGAKIVESAAVDGSLDTLDFSAFGDNLTFRIQSRNRISVTAANGWKAEAQHVERFVPGDGENVFIIEKGAKLVQGQILTNSDSQSVVLSSTTNVLDPNATFTGGVKKAVNVNLSETPAYQSAGIEFTVLNGVTEIIGGRGNDVLVGDEFSNDIRGGKGDDLLSGRGGNDRLLGDRGDDELLGWQGDDVLDGGQGDDVLRGDEDDDVLRGGSGDDTLIGGPGSDTASGGLGDDTFVFAAAWGLGDEVVERSGEGTDTLDFAAVTDDLTFHLGLPPSVTPEPGDQGVPLYFVESPDSELLASNRLEVFVAGRGGNTFRVHDGFADSLRTDGLISALTRTKLVVDAAIASGVTPTGVLDLSAMTAGVTVDVRPARSTDDFLGHNQVTLTFANGRQVQFDHIAQIIGSTGDDEFKFHDGAVLAGDLNGGLGQNTLTYRGDVEDDFAVDPALFPRVLGTVTNIAIIQAGDDDDDIVGDGNENHLRGEDGQDTLDGAGGDDDLDGGAGDDTLRGGGGNDQIRGGRGDDSIEGGEGDDDISAGSGADDIDGGPGDDHIDPGTGADILRFADGWGTDVVESNSLAARNKTLDFTAVTAPLTYSIAGRHIEVGTATFTRDTESVAGQSRDKGSGVFSAGGDRLTVLPAGTLVGNNIQTLKTGSAEQRFYFGNQWTSATIDATGRSSGEKLILDFGGVSEWLRFDFQADNTLKVINLGTFSPVNTIQDDLPGLNAPTITIKGLDANTEIVTGRNENSYRFAPDVTFAGLVTFTAANKWTRVPFTENAVPTGLRAGHRVDLTRPLGNAPGSYVEVVNLATEDPTSLFNDNIKKTISGITRYRFESTTISGKISDVSFGSGVNLIQGDFGNNDFQQKALRPGVSILSGLTGADSYRYANLWGLSFVVEPPDLVVAGQSAPEALDTLDFSAMVGSITVDVYDEKPDWLSFEFNDDHPDLADVNVPEPPLSVDTNYIVVTDQSLGDFVNRSEFDPGGVLTAVSGFTDRSMVFATDIESLVGPKGGTMTVRMHGDAELRGTVTAGSLGSVVLDYSNYDTAVTVDAGAGDLAGLPGLDFLDAFPVPTGIVSGAILSGGNFLPGLPQTGTGSATGISGNRFGGLTTLVDFGDNPINQTLGDIAVVGVSKVIGSPHKDSFAFGNSDIQYVWDGDDIAGLDVQNDRTLLDGTSTSTLDLFASQQLADVTVDLSSSTVTRLGTDYQATHINRVVSGRGNDTIIGSDDDEIFVYQVDGAVGWGVDQVTPGGGADVIDLSGLPESWQWQTRLSLDGSYREIYFEGRTDQIRILESPDNDYRIIDRNGAYSKDQWPKAAQTLSLDSLVTTSVPMGLKLDVIPGPVVSAAFDAFDGVWFTIAKADGTTDTRTLSVVTSDNGAKRLVDDLSVTRLDEDALTFRIIDLPDTQLSSRILSGDILIDTTAGDHGWHVDPASNPPADRVDLLGVVIHELTQRLGWNHSNLTGDTLDPGQIRRSVPTGASLAGGDLNDTPVAASTLPFGAIDNRTPAIDAVIAEAVSRWQAANVQIIGSSTATPTIATPALVFGHLPGDEIARTLADGSILLDPTAAGNTWYVDPDPATGETVPAGQIDLLSVVMHEIGHTLGLGHDTVDGSGNPIEVMQDTIAKGQRLTLPAAASIRVISVDSSDQSKLGEGLDAFADWVADLGTRLDELLGTGVTIPFVGDVSLAGLMNIESGSVTTLASELQSGVIDNVASVFGPDGDIDGDTLITTLDLAAQDNVSFAPASNSVAFVGNVDLSSLDFSESIALDLSQIELAGLSAADLGLSVDSNAPPVIQLDGGIDLNFIFGIDPQGSFYVDAPTLVASFQATSGDAPFDVSVSLGPFGLGIEQGSIDIGAQMSLGTTARLSQADLTGRRVDPLRLLPTLNAGAYYDIDLPLVLAGSLSGFDTGTMALRAEGTLDAGIGSLDSLIDSIELDIGDLDQLFDLRGVSLDQILDGIIAGLDALVDAEGDDASLIAKKIPGLNKSAIDLFGNGTENFIVGLKNAIEGVRDGSSLGELSDDLNAAVNDLFGQPLDPFTITYRDSQFLVDFEFERTLLNSEFAFEVDLNALFQDDIQSFVDNTPLLRGVSVDLSALDVRLGDADGQVKLAVSGAAGVDLGFGIDLNDVTDPQIIFADTSEVYASAAASFGQPVTLNVQLDLNDLIGQSEGDLGSFGFKIKDATADIDVRGAYGLKPNDPGFYSLEDISTDDLQITVDGGIDVRLPLYLTDTVPVGGTEADVDGNGIADNVLALALSVEDASLRGAEFDYEFSGPGVEQFMGIAALLNDPRTLLDGLEGMFDGLQTDIQAKFDELGLPLIGDRLKSVADFLVTLEDDLLGVKQDVANPEGFYYYGGSDHDPRLGAALESAIGNDESVIDLVQRELHALVSRLGNDALKVPDLDAAGRPQFDAEGRLLLKDIQTPEDIGIRINDGSAQFNIVLSGNVFEPFTVPLDFDASVPGLGLKSDDGSAVTIAMDYVFGLGFGLSSSDWFFVDTEGVTESGAEFSLDLSATLQPGTSVEGQLGFLKIDLDEVIDDDGASGLRGSFEIDLQDGDGNGRWAPLRGDSLGVQARLSADANVDIAGRVSFPDSGGLQLPEINTTIHYDQLFAQVEFGTGGSSADFGGSPIVEFADVQMDLGQFITGFVGPIVDEVSKVTDPVKPIVEVLTDDIPLLRQLGASQTSLLDIAKVILGPTKFAPVARGVEAVTRLVEFIDDIDAFDPSQGSPVIDFGSFTIGDEVRSGGSGEIADSTTNDTVAQSNSVSDPRSKRVTDRIGTSKGSFQFPLLTDPLAAFGLLLGKDVDLFKYEMPGLNLNFQYRKSFPIFPGLNARLGGRVTADTDFIFGFDTTGIREWSETDFAINEADRIFQGFFVDDQVSFDGNGAVRSDVPEVSLTSAITAGASVGIAGLVEAGVEGGIRASVGFDLNDVPDPLQPGNVVDGKLRLQEIAQRLDQGASCLFDTSGQLSAFLDAFFWVGLDLGIFGEITVFEARKNFFNSVLADFNFSCPDPSAIVATQSGDVVTVRYQPGPGESVAAGQGESYLIEQEPIDLTPNDGVNNPVDRIIVTSRGSRRYFDPATVATIYIPGTANDDRYIVVEGVTPRIEIHGGAGNDTIEVNSTVATSREIYGDVGNDTIMGSDAIDTIDGGDGNDVLGGMGGPDIILGGDGDDLIEGGDGDDRLDGGDGDDAISGGEGGDSIVGGLGEDRVDGGAGDDLIFGDLADDSTGVLVPVNGGQPEFLRDFLRGGPGVDFINAQSGNDTIEGGPGIDTLLGEDGEDTFEWTVGDGVDATIAGGESEKLVDGQIYEDIDTIRVSGLDASVRDVVFIDPSSANPNDVTVRFESAGTVESLLLQQFGRIQIQLYAGADAVTVSDVSMTTLEAVDVDFGTGEILQTVVLTESIKVDETVLVDDIGNARIFGPDDDYDVDVSADLVFYRQTFDAGEYVFDEAGIPVLIETVLPSGETVLAQSHIDGNPVLVDGLPEFTQVETRVRSRFRDVRLALPSHQQMSDGEVRDESVPRFRRQLLEPGGTYLYDADGFPLTQSLTDSDGSTFLAQQFDGFGRTDNDGNPLWQVRDNETSADPNAENDPIQFESRLIQRSRQERIPVVDASGNPELDADGNPIEEVFITPEYGIDSSADVLTIFGTGGGDTITVLSNDVTVYGTIENSVAFSVANSSRTGGDRLVIETLEGHDRVEASGVEADRLTLDLRTGEGNDTLIGSPFDDRLNSGPGDDLVSGGFGSDAFLDVSGVDTLVEGHDGNFVLTDDTLTMIRVRTDLLPDGNVLLPRQEITRSVDALPGVFELIELRGFDADGGGDQPSISVNRFDVIGFTGQAILDGGAAADVFTITLDARAAADADSVVSIADSGGDGLDQLYVRGTRGADTFQFGSGYVQRVLAVDDSSTGNLFGALSDFTTDINVRNPDLVNLYSQRVEYGSVELPVVSGLQGSDLFIVDDTSVEMTVRGDSGADRFFIGSVRETAMVGGFEVVEDITNGVSYPASFFGGSGSDYFEVNHNVAPINLYGEDGDDTFFLYAHLQRVDADESQPVALGQIVVNSAEGERDILSYVENAPVKINGGAGIDTLVIVGTPAGDKFIVYVEMVEQVVDGIAQMVPVQRIYGAGLILEEVVNVERLILLTGAGDDEIYVNSTLPELDLQINPGSGDDVVHVGGDSQTLDVVIPESTRTEVETIAQPDIVTTDRVLVRPAYSYSKIVGYAIPIFKLFPIYRRIHVPAKYRTITTRTPQPPLLVPREVVVPRRVIQETMPASYLLSPIQGTLTIDGLSGAGLGTTSLVINNSGVTETLRQQQGSLAYGAFDSIELRDLSLRTDVDYLLPVIPDAVSTTIFANVVKNEIRNRDRLREPGLIDDMMRPDNRDGLTVVTLTPGTPVHAFASYAALQAFAAEQNFSVELDPDGNARTIGDPRLGSDSLAFELETEFSLTGQISNIRLVLTEPRSFSVPNRFVESIRVLDTTQYNTLVRFGLDFPLRFAGIDDVQFIASDVRENLQVYASPENLTLELGAGAEEINVYEVKRSLTVHGGDDEAEVRLYLQDVDADITDGRIWRTAGPGRDASISWRQDATGDTATSEHTVTLDDIFFTVFALGDGDTHLTLGSDVQHDAPAMRLIAGTGDGDDTLVIESWAGWDASFSSFKGDDHATLLVGEFGDTPPVHPPRLTLARLVVDDSVAQSPTQWIVDAGGTLSVTKPLESGDLVSAEIVETLDVDHVELRTGSMHDSLTVDTASATSIDGSKFFVASGTGVVTGPVQTRSRGFARHMGFDHFTMESPRHVEDGFELISKDGTLQPAEQSSRAVSLSGEVTLAPQIDTGFALFSIDVLRASTAGAFRLIGDTLNGEIVEQAFSIVAGSGVLRIDLDDRFRTLRRLTMVIDSPAPVMLDNLSLLAYPESTGQPLGPELPPEASAGLVEIDTQTLTINGVASGGQFNGTTFTADWISDGSIAEFRFAGDLHLPDESRVTVVGDRSRGVRFFVAADTIIGDDVVFDFAADGQTPGPGGGAGGLGGQGGDGGDGGLGGLRGTRGSGGTGGRVLSCSFFDCSTSAPTRGDSGGRGQSGGFGTVGRPGTSGGDGGVGINNVATENGGDIGLPGTLGQGGVGGYNATGGYSGDPSNNASGGNGGAGYRVGPGRPGLPGSNGGAGSIADPGSFSPNNPFEISGGQGGGGGAGGAGGSGGGGGGGGAGGSGGGGGGALVEFRSPFGPLVSLSGGNGGYGGIGGTGGDGGDGGRGGDGGNGGGGGGGFEITSVGRIRFAGDRSDDRNDTTAMVDVSGGDAAPADPSRLDEGRTDGGNVKSYPSPGLSGSAGQTGSGRTAGRGGQGSDGMPGAVGADGGEGGLGAAGAGGAAGSVKFVANVISGTSGLQVDARGGSGVDQQSQAGDNGRLIIGAHAGLEAIAGGASPLVESSGDVLTMPESRLPASLLNQNPFVDGSPHVPRLTDLIGGADAYGVLDQVTSADLPDVDTSGNPDAVVAVLRLDSLDTDNDASTSEVYAGYDVLVFANLTSLPIDAPEIGVIVDDEAPTFSRQLSTGGVAVNQQFGGTPGTGTGGGHALTALDGGQVWAMLIPETPIRVTASVAGQYTRIDDLELPSGGVAYLRGAVDSPDSVIAGFDAIAASTDGQNIYAINTAEGRLTVFNADQTERQQMVNGQDGVTGIAAPSDVQISNAGDVVMVGDFTNGTVTIFDRDTSGNLTWAQTVSADIGRGTNRILNVNGRNFWVAGPTSIRKFEPLPDGQVRAIGIPVNLGNYDQIAQGDWVSALYWTRSQDGALESLTDGLGYDRIADVNVSIDVRQNNMDELDVFLSAPDGTMVQLYADVGGSIDSAPLTLDDEAATSIANYNGAGVYRPIESLSKFDATEFGGTWTLTLIDDESVFFINDTSTFRSWTLEIETERGRRIEATNSVVGTFDQGFPITRSVTVTDTNRPAPISGPKTIAVSPERAFVYVVATYENRVDVYRRDTENDWLEFTQSIDLSSQDYPWQLHPSQMRITRDGRHAVFSSTDYGTISVYQRDPASGDLTFLQSIEQDLFQGAAFDFPQDIELLGGNQMVAATRNGLTWWDLETGNPLPQRRELIEFDGVESARVNVAPADFQIDMLPDAPAGMGWNAIERSDHVLLQLVDLVDVIKVSVGESPQRSIVSDLTVQFDGAVDIDADAFSVIRHGDDSGSVQTTFVSTVDANGDTVVTLSFSGDLVRASGSLIDGNYELRVDPSKVRRAGTSTWLDGNGDGVNGGEFVFGAQAADLFFSMFGDIDGDRDVDNRDFAAFARTYRRTQTMAGYDANFDVDQNGAVDNRDFAQFARRYRTILDTP
ncbi:beta-propeller fold lactonase family protein [Crateriforma spongiae]|uniref:beta-propeller fold lactonase family protein n=1 Tax=Crateriforma spongiae TaxID=2724528 RepID=UPI0039B01614